MVFQGDVAETISTFFENGKHCRPSKKSSLTNQEVCKFRTFKKFNRIQIQYNLSDAMVERLAF